MTATITHTLGRFVWRELFTKDVAAAKQFYGGLFGWTFDPRPMGPDFVYTIIQNGDKEIGGIMNIADMPAGYGDISAQWALFVSVDDADAAVSRAVAAGGKELGECHDIPNVGRFGTMQDPQGAVLNVLRAVAGDPPDVTPGLGEFCWENLSTPDTAAAAEFYRKVIGWGVAPMPGSEGRTTLLTREVRGEAAALATIGQSDEGAPAQWGTFVSVEAVTAATAKCQALGGKVLLERTEIPGTGAFGIIADPTGAAVFVFEAIAA